ncbi:MAG TPA: hypothetical protein VE987_11785 [Polyangiaceae bacterium]|nr:hypothetical protein [Polyangiaceae bacterium]
MSLAGVALGGGAACTLLLDHNATQCQTNDDCFRFGGHPFCQGSVCVDSGLQPADCFYGSPSQPADFLNQCSTAQCLPFDRCGHLPACGDADPPLVNPPGPDSGSGGDAGAAGDAATSDASVPNLPSCYDPTAGRGEVVYITGSSNFPPLLKQLAPVIINGQDTTSTGGGPTPVFLTTSSCQGVGSMYTTNHTISDPAPPSTNYAQYFDVNGNAVPCLLHGSVTVDIGESDVYSTTCDKNDGPSPDVSANMGPIQAMAFVVPGASQETSINEEAARLVFGAGGAGGEVHPWTEPKRYYVRSSGTGTQQMIGLAIGVPPGKFWGIPEGTASSLATILKAITDPTEAEQSIGILSVDWYDADRTNLTVLAYQASGQECAYLPDSNALTYDKRNVRDGHYPIWGPLHFFTTNPPSQTAGEFLVNLQESQAVLDAYIGASLVPNCAMTVQRDTELGPLQPYAPHHACGCYFDAKVALDKSQPPPGCQTCSTDANCPAARPRCNYGFCEAQ